MHTSPRLGRRGVLAGGLAMALPLAARAADTVVRIGVLTDIASANGDSAGMGSVEAARMAIEEFAGTVAGHTIDLVYADHQGKPDIGSGIARQWLDRQGVTAIVDVPQSAVALAVMPLVQNANAVLLLSGAGAAPITGKACSPNTIQWTYNTYALATSTGTALVADGNKTWYFVSSDYAFGLDLEHQVTEVVVAHGGKVLGAVHAPFNTPDFSSYLLQAQSSGAQVVAFANAAADTVNSIDDATRDWSGRFMKRIGRMPTQIQAGVYSSVRHYLRAIQAGGQVAGDKVMAAMRGMPVEDMFAPHGVIRADGQMVHDMYFMRVKAPADSKSAWDVFEILHTIQGDQAFPPLAGSECPLVAKG
jgi:branched-chain amino acid transport system substrate-binding protein